MSAFGPSIQVNEQGEQSSEQDCHACELSEVHSRPNPAAGVLSENGKMVIGVPTRMKLGDHDVKELPHEQQPGRHPQRRARAECSVVHDQVPHLISTDGHAAHVVLVPLPCLAGWDKPGMSAMSDCALAALAARPNVKASGKGNNLRIATSAYPCQPVKE
jgi:hypothetical protein